MAKKIAKKQSMDRYEKEYQVDEVLSWVKQNISGSAKNVDMDGHLMKVKSIRYETFIASGTSCKCCGIVGTKFYKERNHTSGGINNGEKYHFNLYAIDKDGEETLMTKDHIIAKSLGGTDHVSNMQTMCYVCNSEKHNMTPEAWEEYIKNKI